MKGLYSVVNTTWYTFDTAYRRRNSIGNIHTFHMKPSTKSAWGKRLTFIQKFLSPSIPAHIIEIILEDASTGGHPCTLYFCGFIYVVEKEETLI